jgi:lysophospholipase L1-like esterase
MQHAPRSIWGNVRRIGHRCVGHLAVLLAAGCSSPTIPPPPPDAPTVSCPASLTVRGVSGAGQSVTYPAAVSAGGAAPVTVTCAPASGAPFAIGTTPVTCTARDALARSAECGFSVTLTAQILSVTKFLAFGDSFTEGQNGRLDGFGVMIVDVPNSYPTKLEMLLNVEYPGQGITVVNAGKGGEPVGDAVARLALQVLPVVRPGAMLLLDGYNNLQFPCHWPSASSAACAAAITEVVVKVRECIRTAQTSGTGVKYVFVSTLTPPGPYISGFDRRIAPDAITQTNARLSTMVRSEGAVLVDPYPLFIGHEAEYVAEDGLHLRPAGYQVLAETFFAAIKVTVSSAPGLGSDLYFPVR